MENLSGSVIKGYELRERIGAGGFGAVYRAHQPTIGREVAIKIVLPQYANHPEFIRRFEAEAQMVARLEHPFIVPLYDYWREPGGAYLVMRYLRGGSLADRLRRQGGLDAPTTLRAFDQICGALMMAHQNGVIHRDLKPANILLDESGNHYLADFGIAKNLTEQNAITQTGMLAGSPAYIAPEQLRGDTVTPQSDVYSLGVMLYEVLTGQHPFDGLPTTALLVKHLSELLPSIFPTRSDLPEVVDDVIQKATAKDPVERYPDTLTLATALRRAFVGESVSTIDLAEVAHRTELLEEADLSDVKNPYKGLRAFQEADAGDFFGREALVQTIRKRLLEEADPLARFLAVVGPSGSGKSSAVKAGVIPTLRHDTMSGSGSWFIVEMVPAAHPLEELEAALLRVAVNPPESLLSQLKGDERGLLRASKRVLPADETQLFLYIDQFEEVFTLVEDEAERAHFLSSLYAAVTDPTSRLRIVISLRADFYDKPLNYPNFGELIRRRTELVLPLNPTELEAAITGPAHRIGAKPEPSLVTAIVSDVQEQPGALPLLQYALTELFERREGRLMTLAAYREIGGTLGALARRADEIYENLNPAGQEAARQLFLRLVTPGEGGEDTRRRILQEELRSVSGSHELMQHVLDTFSKYRLLTFDRSPVTRSPTVEVAHEALLRRWTRLRRWLDDAREDLRIQRRVHNEAAEWLNAGRDSSFLARGSRLAQFEDWIADTSLALTSEERAYLDASIAAHKAQEAAEAARLARERALEARNRQRLRQLAGVFAAAAVVAVLLSIVAISQSQEAASARQIAEQNAIRAERSADEATSIALAANAGNALTADRPTLALALALESSLMFDPPLSEAERTLARIAYAPGAARVFGRHPQSVTSAAFSPDGQLAVTGSTDAIARLWDTQTGAEIRSFGGHSATITTVAISPSGQVLATGSVDTTIRLWNLQTGTLLLTLEGHTDRVNALAFNPTGETLVSVANDQSIRFWNTATGAVRRVIPPADTTVCTDPSGISCNGHSGSILDVAYSAEGRFIVTSSGATNPDGSARDRVARVWNVSTGEQVRVLAPDDENAGFVRAVDITADGQYVISASYDLTGGKIRLWSVSTGRQLRLFEGHNDVITSIAFSPGSQTFASGSWDRTLRIWETATGLELQRFVEHTDNILATVYSPDGQYILTGAGNLGGTPNDTRAILWNLRNRAEVIRFRGHRSWVWSVTFSPDGTRVLSTSGRLQNTGGDNSARVWDAATGEQRLILQGHTHVVSRAVYSPDGRWIATSSWDGFVILWDATTGNELARYTGHIRGVNSVAFSPDGQYLLSGSSDWTMHLLRIVTDGAGVQLQQVRRFGSIVTADAENQNAQTVVYVLFSPDGRYGLSTSRDGIARLWSLESGELVREFSGHTARLESADFSRDGTLLVTASWDGTAIVWDVATGSPVQRFTGHGGYVVGVAFSPDGQFVLSGASDNTILLWRISNGEEVRRYEGHSNWVLSVAFSPDGQYIVSGAEDDTTRIWRIHITLPELVNWIENNRYVRPLTADERSQYRAEETDTQPEAANGG